MAKDNNFQYTSSGQHDLAMLNATMSDFSYAKHAHEEYSLGITLQGRQDFFCRNAYYKSTPGRVMLFNPEDIHDGHSGVAQNLEYLMIYIHPAQLQPLFKALGYRANSPLRLNNTLLDDALLRQQILDLSQLLEGQAHSTIEFEANLFQLAQSLTRLHGSLALAPQRSRTDTLLLRAKEYIQANLSWDLSIADIAAAASMSKFHFIRLFRAQFGITPHQYVLNCRINNARKALQQGNNATQAAIASGFADASHLNRNFKRVFAMTPKQFQNQWFR